MNARLESVSPPVVVTFPRVGWGLTIFASVPLLGSAVAKLLSVPEVAANFEKARLLQWLRPIGVLEIVVTVLLLVPRTASLGVLLVTGYLGGAVVTHLESGEASQAIVPLVIGAIAWAGHALRFPQVFSSFRQG